LERIQTRIWCLVALVSVAVVARSAPVGGVEADRQEAAYEKEYPRATAADAYLNSIVERLVAAAQKPGATQIRIRAVRSEMPFVFALGNGATYVSTGLIARVSNDSQLAALIAPEIAGVIAPNTVLEGSLEEKNRKLLGAKLLAIVATAGVAAFPMASSEAKQADAHYTAVILDNDKTALGWARQAGFDIAQAPLATQRLKELLAAESLTGANRLSNASGLDNRGTQLTHALQALADPAAKAPTADAAEPLKTLSRKFSIDLVRLDFEHSRREGILPVLDRIDREHGVSSDTACLRARYHRELGTSSEITQQVIDAYQACVNSPGAPVENYKELGYLYRDKGDAAGAARAFEKYLSLAPNAVDAPIIRTFIEELRAKH
jgi:hypothetical protein